MSVFFSPHSDVMLAVLSIALILAGVCCTSLSRDTASEKNLSSWGLVGTALILLSLREWLGIFGLSEPGFTAWYPIASVMQAAASIVILRASSKEAAGNAGAEWLTRAAAVGMAILLAAFLAIGGRHAGTGLFYLIKGSMFLATTVFAYSCLKGRNAPVPGMRPALAVLVLISANIFICLPPGLPNEARNTTPLTNDVMLVLFLLRIALGFAMAALLWNIYAKFLGVTGKIRWWPIAFMLFLISLTVLFVFIYSRNYNQVVFNNLAAAARNAASDIPPDALAAAASNRGSANDPAVAKEVFGDARQLERFVGYAPVATRVDAIALLPEENTAVAVIDVFGYNGVTGWAEKGPPAQELWEQASQTGFAVENGNTRLSPMIIAALIQSKSSEPAGAAVLSVSTADLASNMYVFRRLVLLFLAPSFLILLILISRQQRSWLASHSSDRMEALRMGAMGNELTSVMLLNDDIVVDVNQRCLDILGVDRKSIIGANSAGFFESYSPGSLRQAADFQVVGDEGKTTSLEITLHRPDGRIVHLLAYGRPLSDNPLDNHVIWEAVDITRTKMMENETGKERDRLQMVLDNLQAAVFVKDHHGRYIMANEAFANLFGLGSVEEILGKTSAEVLRKGHAVSQANDEICVDMNGVPLIYDQVLTTLDGVEKHIEISKSAKKLDKTGERYYIVGSVHDFTDRKRAQDAISTERSFLHQLINALPLSVCFVDCDRIIRLCDKDFCREAGTENPDELAGQPFDAVAPFGAEPAVDDDRMLARGNGYSDTEFTAEKNGRKRMFTLRRIPMTSGDGDVIGLVKAYWDTTALVRASRAATAGDRTKLPFPADLSHELRTPLNGIIGMASLVVDHDETPPVLGLYAETIIKSAKTLQMIMDETMDFVTGPDSRERLEPGMAPFPLLALAEEAVQVTACVIEAWGGELHFSYDFDLHSIYAGDAQRVRQAMLEPLIHCSRLAADKKITFQLSSTGLKDDGRVILRALFRPIDGLTPRKLQEKFARAPEASPVQGIFNEKTGLPLAAKLVEAMGGRISVALEGDRICCETVLPMASSDAAQAAAPLNPPDLSRLRTLIATADPLRADAIRSCLEYAGARTVSAATPDEAREANRRAHADGDPFALLVLDVNLNPPAAEECFGEFLRNPESERQGLLLITSLLHVQNAGASDKHVDGILIPPICPSELWYKAAAIARKILPPAPAGERGGKHPDCPEEQTAIPARVLLVEDNSVNQMVGMSILQRIGCTPVLAKNGREALDKVSHDAPFDIIFMDCAMPEMDGYEAASKIRLREKSVPGGKRNAIVALTASSTAEDREKCLAAGMDDFITKPVTTELLRGAMRAHCPWLNERGPEGTDKQPPS